MNKMHDADSTESALFWKAAEPIKLGLADLINEADPELVRQFCADLMRHLNLTARASLAMQVMTYEADCENPRPRGGQRDWLLALADEMGPDWAQVLYQAAVFVTKVA